MELIDLLSRETRSNNTAAEVALSNDASDEELGRAAERAYGGAISIAFPKFNDGRGFSIARLLRDRFGFEGEIRAVGNVIPDQAVHLLRAGFDTVEIADASDIAAWQTSLSRYSGAYQSAFRNPSQLRRSFSPDAPSFADPTASPPQPA